MSTLTITLEDSEARLLELAARKEHQPVEAWARVRLRRAASDCVAERRRAGSQVRALS